MPLTAFVVVGKKISCWGRLFIAVSAVKNLLLTVVPFVNETDTMLDRKPNRLYMDLRLFAKRLNSFLITSFEDGRGALAVTILPSLSIIKYRGHPVTL